MSNQVDIWAEFTESIKEALGAYEPTPIITEFLRYLLSNIYEDIVLVDGNGRIALLAQKTEEYFGLDRGEANGRMFSDFWSDIGVVEVAKTGIPQIARVQEVRGTKKIVTRLPLFKDGRLIGAVGKVVFEDLDEIKNLYLKIEELEAKITGYKQEFISKNKAIYTFDDIVGISQSIKETKERAMRIAKTDSAVLLTGESGTGKELFAHSIHQASHRARGPFIRINCANIPFELAESELFGYEKGAFTGASKIGQKGKFELASEGTIFLDEISAMPLVIQAKLLRILQEKEIQPLGSSKTKKVDFRLIAASNVELPLLIEKGSFRPDLYYRLSAAPIHLSPLRERREDISFLAKFLLSNINQRVKGTVVSITSEALNIMDNYQWPGNVRELINVLEQSILNAYPRTAIEKEDLPPFLLHFPFEKSVKVDDIKHSMEQAEKKRIRLALEKNKGNKRKTAKDLGISRAGLYQKLHRLKMI